MDSRVWLSWNCYIFCSSGATNVIMASYWKHTMLYRNSCVGLNGMTLKLTVTFLIVLQFNLFCLIQQKGCKKITFLNNDSAELGLISF